MVREISTQGEESSLKNMIQRDSKVKLPYKWVICIELYTLTVIIYCYCNFLNNWILSSQVPCLMKLKTIIHFKHSLKKRL